MIYCLWISSRKVFVIQVFWYGVKNINPKHNVDANSLHNSFVLLLTQKELEINIVLLSIFTSPNEKFYSLLIFLYFVLSLRKDRLCVQLNIFHHTQGYFESILGNILYFFTFIFLEELPPLFPQSIELIFFLDKEERMKVRGKKVLLLKELIKQHK